MASQGSPWLTKLWPVLVLAFCGAIYLLAKELAQ